MSRHALPCGGSLLHVLTLPFRRLIDTRAWGCPTQAMEIIADNLSKAGFSWGCVSAIDSNGRTIWIADAHRDDGKRFVVRADEKLTAFVELEAAIRSSSESS